VGRLRLTRRRRALLGFALGCALVVSGTWVWLGVAGGLIVAGVITAASFLTLSDVEEGTREPPAVAVSPQRFNDPTL